MKKILRYKVFMTLVIVMLLILVAFSMATVRLTKLTPCEDEQDHFTDESGNGYCIAEELVQDFENTPVVVLEDSGKGDL
jgi:hypothetical protein